jgi:xanthine dehydrogenase accessory factor
MPALTELAAWLARHDGVLVTVQSLRGSGPREPGAWMAVSADGVLGTVGGGHLEYDAVAHARSLLAQGPATDVRRYALGPTLGQCCGGVVHLAFERVSAADLPRLQARLAQTGTPVALFGGGHVGHAIVRLLGALPFAVQWIDSRDGIFAPDIPPNVACDHSEPVHCAVASLAPGSRVLVMSFSHAEDLDITAACLQRRRDRDDLPFIGLIGSGPKWTTFRRRLEDRGFTPAELDGVHCPIGVPGIIGKQPEVIAVSVVAQLLHHVSQAH